MDRSTPLVLIKKTYTADSIGQRIATETRRTVYCNIQSVSRAEFYAGGEHGLKPEYVATMFAPDYEGEETCEITINNVATTFAIYRTYLDKNEMIELYLEKKVGK